MVEIRLPRGGEIEAELADDLPSRARGLSFRTEGKMLFRFPGKGRPAIDMMFLSVPLQLVFLDSGREVVDVQRAEPWTLDPRSWRLYRPEHRSKFLLESTEFLDIQEGDRLEFEI